MNIPEFPISLWPGVPIPLPPVCGARAEVTDGELLVYEFDEGDPATQIHLDDEVVLRELRVLDTTDVDCVVEFVSRYGAINPGNPNGPQALVRAQALARHFVAFIDDDHLLPVWDWDGSLTGETDEFAWELFVGSLNEGLLEVPPRAEYMVPTGSHGVGIAVDESGAGWRTRPAPASDELIGPPLSVGLYSALCIQLYNLILEGGELKTCANETCRFGGRFINQRGTAKHGQHRSIGVKYCTNACARIQGTRDNRRRKRAEAKGEQ